MTVFTVYTMDGDKRTFDDNTEGFLVRWQNALCEPRSVWPHAYMDGGEQFVDGIKREMRDSTVTFNPHTIVAVEVELSEDG